MTDPVLRAERTARKRAILFYLLAIALIAGALLALGLSPDAAPAALIAWTGLALLTSINLLPFGARLRGSTVNSLLDDETTRYHRRIALQTGFWAAVVVAVGLMGLSTFVPMQGTDVARLILGAALAAALISFAAQERRALRDG